MTYKGSRPAFYGRTDAQQERLLAPHCVECGGQYPVAADPGACAPLELKSIETLDRGMKNELIRFRGLDEKGRHFICGDCAAYLMDFLIEMFEPLLYTPERQGSDAGFSFVPAFLSNSPSSSGSFPGATLAGTQAESRMGDFCFMAKGNIGKRPWNWKGGRTVTQAGYVLIFVGKGHPIADVRGYVYEHRLKAWLAGHDIDGKHVHHEDEIKDHNDESNLIPLTFAEHRFQHRKPGCKLRLLNEPNESVACACGCGETFLKFDSANRPRKYVSGHNPPPEPTTMIAIVAALRGGPKHREMIIRETGLSRHAVIACLSKLKRRGLVGNKERGTWEII